MNFLSLAEMLCHSLGFCHRDSLMLINISKHSASNSVLNPECRYTTGDFFYKQLFCITQSEPCNITRGNRNKFGLDPVTFRCICNLLRHPAASLTLMFDLLF